MKTALSRHRTVSEAVRRDGKARFPGPILGTARPLRNARGAPHQAGTVRIALAPAASGRRRRAASIESIDASRRGLPVQVTAGSGFLSGELKDLSADRL